MIIKYLDCEALSRLRKSRFAPVVPEVSVLM